MQAQSIWCSGRFPGISVPISSSSSHQLRKKSISTPLLNLPRSSVCLSNADWRNRTALFRNSAKWRGVRISPFSRFPAEASVDAAGVPDHGVDDDHGQSGPVMFSLGETGLVPSPIGDGAGSTLWLLGPAALISTLFLPQFFLSGVVEALVKDDSIAEIVMSFFSEVVFYIGLSLFLFVTERVQRPYHEFSQKQWGLITDHRSYLYSAYLTMGVKVFAPLLAAYLVWPVIGLPCIVAVAPFLLGLAAQYAFEDRLYKRKSSCWPLLVIIFEVYRLYQLNRGAHFVERLMFLMRGSPMSHELLERSSALVSMLTVFQVLGIASLWSLTAFLIRLFPLRFVVEK